MKIGYWATCCLDPAIEAVSKELYELADAFSGRFLFSTSPHVRCVLSPRSRTIGLHPALYPLLRLIVPVLEKAVDVSHVYGEASPWLYHKALRRKPIVLTIANESGAYLPEFLDRCKVITVQTSGMRERLAADGIAGRKVRLIYPGIDLQRFAGATRPPRGPRVRIAFATFPRGSEELHGRGVDFLLAAARALPHAQFLLVSRPWRTGGTALPEVKAQIAANGLANIEILEGVQGNMASVFARSDFVVLPYATRSGGKECPLSVVEGLASGLPALVSEHAPFSEFVLERGCGAVFPLTVAGFADAIERARSRYEAMSAAAIETARGNFDRLAMLRNFSEIYGQVGA